MANTAPPPAILLMGPTASGKTAVAVQLTTTLPCEIISVDSALVYKGMDIGTAKPDAATLARAPHHLINIIEPHESYSAARFRDDALVLMREITERGNIPLLVGGTMLYFKSLVEGLNDLPEADSTVRLIIETMAEEEGWPAVHEKLRKVDPQTAARLDPNDSQRVQRALEIYYITGKSMTDLLKKPKYVYFPYTPIRIALLPIDRSVLHDRIALRFEKMLDDGLVDELRALRDEYALEPDMPSMRCVGYRQAWEALDSLWPIPELRDRGVFATRQLAKRQITWLRASPERRAIPCEAPDALAQVLALARAFARNGDDGCS